MTTKPAPEAPARPALRYHGGKWRLAPWIVSCFPQLAAYDAYVEPYGGSAAVLLRKERSPIEVLNDLDGDVVNYFRTLRDCPDVLIRSIEFTPFSRREWEAAEGLTSDPIEMARRFYLRSYGSISGPTAQWRTGWRRQKTLTRTSTGTREMSVAAQLFADTEHLYTVAARLRGVFIEDRPAISLMQDYDGDRVLFYVDPPYPAQARRKWKSTAYRHEMSDEDHRELATTLNEMTGMVILSGYDCDLYRELFPDSKWMMLRKQSRTNGNGTATEVLWLNEAARAAMDYERMPLFRAMGEG